MKKKSETRNYLKVIRLLKVKKNASLKLIINLGEAHKSSQLYNPKILVEAHFDKGSKLMDTMKEHGLHKTSMLTTSFAWWTSRNSVTSMINESIPRTMLQIKN